ncbi:DUF5977 domain-containing protein [Terrimonas rubra]|uniref:DUF5977 domain-containing protein n=1 Tax=Terrimonas rubra TaxID=1035890 RepID=A0ABW6A5C9_9BACT
MRAKKIWTRKFVLLMCSIVSILFNLSAQDYNNNAKLTFINHNVPKSPESASIERYGTIPVSEKTGIPDISIPLFNAKGSALSSPLALSYHASGIKVNQEATWVGLGWDLRAGGRITLEIKGGYDRLVNQFLGTGMKETIKFLTQMHGNVSNNFIINETDPCNWTAQAVYDYAHNNGPIPCYAGVNIDIDSLYDISRSSFREDKIKIEQYGIGEPDLYHAEFLGQSFTFYHDLLTDSIKIVGDQNKYIVEDIGITSQSIGTVGQYFKITDTNGITYYFEKQEISYYVPGILSNSTITTAFLLTKVTSLSGDLITYTYTNYGESFSAPTISESELSVISSCNNPAVPVNQTDYTNRQYSPSNTYVTQFPQYLTEINTNSTRVQFLHGNRKDISGDGNRKLEQIIIKNKESDEVIQQVKFNYSYFNGNSGHYYIDTALSYFKMGTPGPDNNAKNHLTLRLKLESINIYAIDSNLAQTYKFGYIDNFFPNKVSMAQDHWGYYNGAYDMPLSQFANFTPSVQALYEEGIYGGTFNPSQHQLLGHTVRKASLSYAKTYTLDQITYPTGGNTRFEYELHKFYISGLVSGAGLRVKKIINTGNYNDTLAAIEYDYNESGFYQGVINYVQNKFKDCQSEDVNYNTYFNSTASVLTLFSNGVLSTPGPLVLYSFVTQRTSSGEFGRIEKQFDVTSPHSGPYVEQVPLGGSGYYTGHPYNLSPFYLPVQRYEYSYGNLTSERYYDKMNTLKKEKQYYYNGNVVTKLNTFKLESKGIAHPSNMLNFPETFIHYFEPVVFRNDILDSLKEFTYENGQVMSSITRYKYNAHFQNEFTSTMNSNGEQSITYTKTPLSFNDVPWNADTKGNAKSVSYMRYHNILDVPVEKVIMKRSNTGDTSILMGAYNTFDPIGNIQKTYLLEATSPVPMNQFQKSIFSGPFSGGDTIKIDSRYSLNKAVRYGGAAEDYGDGTFWKGPHINEYFENKKNTAVINDTINNIILAVCENASYNEIAYTSFESINAKGRWVFTGGLTIDLSSPTGSKCYDMGQAGGNITCSGLDQNKIYLLSYWTKNASAYPVTGTISGSVKEGPILQGWTYFEQKITGQNAVAISGSGYIDEIKLYPADAQMKSFIYDAKSRMSAETDVSGKIIYYQYDPSNRLSLIKDQYGKILKQYAYKLALQKVNFDGEYYLNHAQSQSFTKNNCSSGQPQSIVYGVAEGKYKSAISQADADQQATNDIAANGQAYANINAGCQFFSHEQSITFTQNNCSSGYFGMGTASYGVPANKFVSFISQHDANQMAIAELNSISANGQTVANQGPCLELIPVYCGGSLNEDFGLELFNADYNVMFYFTVNSNNSTVYVPAGNYFLRINPINYTMAYNYVVNDNYYQSGEIVATFDNITISGSNYNNIYIYE